MSSNDLCGCGCKCEITLTMYGARYHGGRWFVNEAHVEAQLTREWQGQERHPCTVPGCGEARLKGQTRCRAHFREAQKRSEARRRELREERRAAP